MESERIGIIEIPSCLNHSEEIIEFLCSRLCKYLTIEVLDSIYSFSPSKLTE